MSRTVAFAVGSVVLAVTSTAALAVPCGGEFGSFIAGFSRDAAAQGVSAHTLAVLDGLTPTRA